MANCQAGGNYLLHRSAAASVMGMVKDDPTFLQRCLNRRPHSGSQQPSALCIGIGGGSLPLFLSHHFPGMRVEAVDLDPAVLAAASQAMGFPLDRCTTHPTACFRAATCPGTKGRHAMLSIARQSCHFAEE